MKVYKVIIAACVGVWLMELANPALINGMSLDPQMVALEPGRLITSMFVHAPSPIHIVANMISLYFMGSFVEDALGKNKFLFAYFACGLAGSIAYLMSGATIPAVGASGAIFGLLGMALPMSGYALRVWGFIALNLFISFGIPGIAWQAHLGGLALGVFLGFIMWKPEKIYIDGLTGRQVEPPPNESKLKNYLNRWS